MKPCSSSRGLRALAVAMIGTLFLPVIAVTQAAAWDELKLPSGADFFQFRTFVAEHDDTFIRGPTTAADFLATRSQPEMKPD